MSEKIRVIIADDHPIVRSGLRLMLGMEEGIGPIQTLMTPGAR